MNNMPPFTSGPFLSASSAVEDAACNFYFSYLLQETVAEQLKIEGALDEAIRLEDPALIEQLKIDLSLIEGAYHLSSFVGSKNTQ